MADYSDEDYRDAAKAKYGKDPRFAGLEYDARVMRGFKYTPGTFEKIAGANVSDTKDRTWWVEDNEVPEFLPHLKK